MDVSDPDIDGAPARAAPKGARERVKRAVRVVLRRVFTEVQFWMLYAWHWVMGPPRVLRFRHEMNARLLRAFGAKIGADVRILSPITLNLVMQSYRNLTVGDCCIINGNNFLDLSETITLEDYVSLGPGVVVMTHNRFNRNAFLEKRLSRMCGRKPVLIKWGAGIKANALILHGVTIGESAVVAGASVVIKDVPAKHFVGGVPAVTRVVLG